MRRITARLGRPGSSRWSLLGMLALGLVAGAALSGYAVARNSHLKRFSAYTRRLGDGPVDAGSPEASTVVAATVPRSNHRRKATSEV